MGRYNLTQHTTTLPVVCHFTSCVLLKNHRTSLGPDPKIRSKRSSLTSSLCFTDLGLLRPPLGGADRNRTDDPLLAKQVLSQLSYSPVSQALVGLDGFEPSTPALSRRCSNQLSYRPVL